MTSSEYIKKQLDQWRQSVEELNGIETWLRLAEKELVGAQLSDPRRATYHEVLEGRDRLLKEIEEVERHQEESLTAYLEDTGPVTLELKGGSRRVLAARRCTAGGDADLLPADLLKVWRVAAVFKGSVETPLVFGQDGRAGKDRGGSKLKRPKREVETGELVLLRRGELS